MKKLLTVIIVFVLFIVTSLTVDILRQQFYPYEYQDVMESFFGKYHIKKEHTQSEQNAKGDKYSYWRISCSDKKDDYFINNEYGFFSQLHSIYMYEHENELKQKIDCQNIDVSLRNAYDSYSPNTTVDKEIPNDDQMIHEKYNKMYPKQFQVYKHQDITKLFEEKPIPLYFIVICESQEIAQRFIKEIKNVNAIIKIVSHERSEEGVYIDHETMKGNEDSYLFVYQGKYIDNGVEIMGQVAQKDQGYRTISNDTIVYNYNEFIKNHLKF